MPVEILCGNGKSSEPLQLPIQSYQPDYPISSTKQAFLDMASAPLINLDECNESINYSDCEDPEILLSDSDEEDEDDFSGFAGNEELDAETCIGSDDLNDYSDCESSSDMDVFDEPRSCFELNFTQPATESKLVR